MNGNTKQIFIYYETIEGESGLAKLTEDGVSETGHSTYGTVHDLAYETFSSFMDGPNRNIDLPDDLVVDQDGFYHPDDHLRFKVIEGKELNKTELQEL